MGTVRTAFIALALLLAGHAWADAPPADCDPVDGITSICGLVAPEDIELLPGGRYLVFSQMQEGLGLSLLDTRDDSVRPLYPPGATQAEISACVTFAASIAATVALTGGCSVGSSPLAQRRRDSNIGSWRCRSVGCCAHASMIICRHLNRCVCLAAVESRVYG